MVAAIETVQFIHEKKREGEILVFLTSQDEITAFIEILSKDTKKYKIKINLLPLFANMTLEAQLEVFKPSPRDTRKIIVSTNIAESSVTIDGVVYVVDCCFHKVKVYDTIKNLESMKILPISKQQAI